MGETRRIVKRIQILAGILVMICTGMLFALKIQTVNAASGSVRLNKTTLLIMEGKTKKLKLKNATKRASWESTKPNVAEVSSKGVVLAKSAGTCRILAKSAGATYSCKVTVYNNRKKYKYNRLQQTYKTTGNKNKNKIVVAGSSCIAHWKNAASALRPYKVVNMGVGGSTTKQWLKWYKKLIVAYEPRAVILYPGTRNELKRVSMGQAISDTSRLLKKLHRELPDVPIYYVSIYQNLLDKEIWPLEEFCNEKMKEVCDELENVYYIDVTGVLAGEEGPRTDIFVEGGLHMNKTGYSLWNTEVASIVKEALKKENPGKQKVDTEKKKEKVPEKDEIILDISYTIS